MKQLKKNKRPVVLTVKGKAAAVVQDAEAYQHLVDIAAHVHVEEGIRQAWRTRKKERSGRRGSFSTISKPSMAYLVNITSRAERDLAHLYGEIYAGHSDAALKSYRGLKETILSLEDHPNRCPATPENVAFDPKVAPLLGAIPLFIPRDIDNGDEIIALDAVLAAIGKHRPVQRSPFGVAHPFPAVLGGRQHETAPLARQDQEALWV